MRWIALSIKQIIQDWYVGKFVPYENEPNSGLIFIGGTQQRHWTALAAAALIHFYLAHWKWIIGTAVAIVAMYLN